MAQVGVTCFRVEQRALACGATAGRACMSLLRVSQSQRVLQLPPLGAASSEHHLAKILTLLSELQRIRANEHFPLLAAFRTRQISCAYPETKHSWTCSHSSRSSPPHLQAFAPLHIKLVLR